MRHRVTNTRKYIIGAIVIVVIVAAFFLFYSNSSSSNNSSSAVSGSTRGTQELNKDFSFPIGTAEKDKEAQSLKMVIEKAELVDEIVVKGQKATAVPGRTFLILSIKLTNPSEQNIKMDTRNYIRLSVNKNEGEFLAPDIHNDPVEIQAISTKYTRVGFPVNTTDTDFVLQVGEIKGEKQKIELTIKP